MAEKIVCPSHLVIDGNASCQLRCPTCPTTGNGYPPVVGCGHLSFDNFKNLLDTSPFITSVEFENRGELFLNAELLKILQYAYHRKVALYCNSGANFNTVKEDVLEGLVKYRFRSLMCSIDGASEESYEKYRIRGNFNQVMENIRIINEYKKKFYSELPRLTWQFVVFGHNEHELEIARRRARQMNMQFVPKMSWDSEFSPIRNREFVLSQTGWPALTREEYKEKLGKDYMRGTCYSLWLSPHINWDGKVLGCCWNSWMEFGGNVFSDGYEKSINKEKITYARKMLTGHAKPRSDIPCTDCDLYKRLVDSDRYLTEREIHLPSRWWYKAARGLYRRVGVMRILRRRLSVK